MEYEDNEYGEAAVNDMMADCDHHINIGGVPELYDESSVDEEANDIRKHDTEGNKGAITETFDAGRNQTVRHKRL